ncbi:MAG: hypothetical protein ACR2KJ_16515 [Jatrophihabitans sp.]
MSLAAKLRRAPGRIAAGVFLLNAGTGKVRSKSEEQAKGIHGMAAGAYPFLAHVEPKLFFKALGAAETVLGAALLLPLVPAGLAGLGVTGFGGGLLGVYVRTPGMHDDKWRPTQQGTPIAKDVWLTAIGVGLVIDAALSESSKSGTKA